MPSAETRKTSKQRQRARNTRNNQEFVNSYKLIVGCTDCGYDLIPQALAFDHLPGFIKLRNVSSMLGKSRKSLLAEIAKCEVVCLNCHAERTEARKQVFVQSLNLLELEKENV